MKKIFKFRAWDKELCIWSDIFGNYKIKNINDYADYEICEYTGVNDKNGNEIYEGDIVWVTDSNDCTGPINTGIGMIEFWDGLWYIGGHIQDSLYDINRIFQIEVIGNVYENAELINGMDEESDLDR